MHDSVSRVVLMLSLAASCAVYPDGTAKQTRQGISTTESACAAAGNVAGVVLEYRLELLHH
jgi:hypothetical protein